MWIQQVCISNKTTLKPSYYIGERLKLEGETENMSVEAHTL